MHWLRIIINDYIYRGRISKKEEIFIQGVLYSIFTCISICTSTVKINVLPMNDRDNIFLRLSLSIKAIV